MTGKSKHYWTQKWNNSTYARDLMWFGRQTNEQHKNVINTFKTLDLLSQYAAFYKRTLLGFPHACGGSIGRFFSGRWNTHHGDLVQRAISNFFEMDGYFGTHQEFYTPEFVLTRVKGKMMGRPMNENGDLARIIKVIEEKTGVNYEKIDVSSVVNKYGTMARM